MVRSAQFLTMLVGEKKLVKELTNAPIYEKLNKKYKELLLDYVLLEPEAAYHGKASHKEATAEAIR